MAGVVLFLALPFFLYLLELSLRHESGFAQALAVLRQPGTRLLLLLVIAALAHHVLAGLRHLGLDMHWGVDKVQSRRSAAGVMIATGVVTLVAAWGFLR